VRSDSYVVISLHCCSRKISRCVKKGGDRSGGPLGSGIRIAKQAGVRSSVCRHNR
jgi:hypothetical protein